MKKGFKKSDSLITRLERQVMHAPYSGCMLWTSFCSKAGYGRIYHNGKIRFAHTVMYEAKMGKVPNGLQLDHLCRTRCCVNPLHLEPVTQRENVLRGVGPTAINAKKTHCSNGHLFLPENIHMDHGELRKFCPTCTNASRRKRYARDYAQNPDSKYFQETLK